MPVTWNVETEAKLFAGIFKVCEVKVSKIQLEKLAAMIGPECTPKAITHRLAKLKCGKSLGGTPLKGAGSGFKSGGGRKGGNGATKGKGNDKKGVDLGWGLGDDDVEEDDDEEEEEVDAGDAVSPAKGGRKGAKRGYVEDEGEGEDGEEKHKDKKIKLEEGVGGEERYCVDLPDFGV